MNEMHAAIAYDVAASFGPAVTAELDRLRFAGRRRPGQFVDRFVDWGAVGAVAGLASLILTAVQTAFAVHAAIQGAGGTPRAPDVERRVRLEITGQFTVVPDAERDRVIAEVVRRVLAEHAPATPPTPPETAP